MAEPNLSRQEYSGFARFLDVLRHIAIVLIVPAITAMGYCINNTIQEQAISREYVELAISVLRGPEPESNEQQRPGLREWAVTILEHKSPVPIPTALKNDFADGRIGLPQAQPLALEIPPYRDTENSAHCDTHLRYGYPSEHGVLCRLGFALSYDEREGVRSWVGYRLLAGTQRVVEQRFPFTPDPALPGGRAVLDAFRGSGFDRGHLVPSFEMAWHYSTAREVQFHSNVSPQHASLNRGSWLALDQAIRGWVDKRGALFVVAGPVFDSDSGARLNETIRVPDAYFKVVYDPAEEGVLAFLVPNDEDARSYADLAEFLVTVDDIERSTGLDLLSALPENLQTTLEGVPGVIWDTRP